MSEIFSAIRLKEKILIISLMTVLAILVGGATAVVSIETADTHRHDYEFYLERGYDGEFDFVGRCTDKKCEDPYFIRDIVSGVYESVKTAPTCSAVGVKEYTFTFESITYSYFEEIEMLEHNYVGEVILTNKGACINARCRNEGCTAPELVLENVADISLSEVVPATCITPRKDTYSFEHNGETIHVTQLVNQDTPHTINGVFITEYEISDGVYLFGTKGLYSMVPTILCGNTTSGYFQCEVCNKAQAILLGKPDHVFAFDESDIKYPTLDSAGSVKLHCTNDGCEDEAHVVLPKAEIGVNAEVILEDAVEQRRVIKYTYANEEYDFTIDYEFEAQWIYHEFVYVPDRTVAPTLDREGKAIVECTIDGCNELRQIVLPKISVGDNAVVISEATELKQRVVKYTYTSEIYGFTVELDLKVGGTLSHAYYYELELNANGGIDFVGRCDQPDCTQPEIREENVETTITDTSTCLMPGEIIYTYERDGNTYTFTMVSFVPAPHHYVWDEADLVKPTFTREGHVKLRCSTEGCEHSVTLILPKVEIDVNAEIIEETDEHTVVKYSYLFEEYNYLFTVELHFSVN